MTPSPSISWAENTIITECTQESGHQGEGMGLLVYPAMPSLRDVAHDGVVCTTVQLVIDQPQAGVSGVVRQGRRHGPTITYKITYFQPGGPP